MIDENIEKSLKRFLKRKISVNESVVVKFLITGLIGATLTACGGGGGGGGSSSGGVTPPTINSSIGQEVTSGGTFTTEKDIDMSSVNADSVIGILGTKTNIINDKKITVNDKASVLVKHYSPEAENILDAFKKSGNSFAIFADGGSVVNKKDGRLEISGDNVHAITGLYADITNDGTITTGGNEARRAVGILSFGGNVTNNGEILLESEDATGINIVNNSKVYYTDTDYIEIKGKGKASVLNSGTISVTGESPVGISATGSDIDITNSDSGKIIVNNTITKLLKRVATKGISIDTDDENPKSHDINVTNNGKIALNISSKIENLTDEFREEYFNNWGIAVDADKTNVNNTGNMEVNITAGLLNQMSAGIKTEGENNTINNDGNINVSSNGKDSQENYFALAGINAEGNNTTIKNKNITITAENKCTEINGIFSQGNNGNITNYGDIKIDGKNSESIKGIIVTGNGNKITNTGKIEISGNNSLISGIYTSGNNASSINNGEITVTGDNSDGILAELNTTATNNGIITVIGNDSSGMSAEQGATVINDIGGTININGKNSYGMKANGTGSSATNKGTINVGANASGGMLATNGATISNEGTINIDSSHGLNDDTKAGFALQTDESSKIINTGTIKADETVTVTSGTNYVLGTNSNGSYGKISAENISVDGNVKVSTEIVKGSYKDSYILDDVMTGKTELKENYKLSSTSVLYGASSKVDEKGNLDIKLSKENKFSDFTSKEYDGLASVLDEALNKKDLSANAKEVLDSVFASSTTEENLRNRLKEISGVEYTNIARQIFDTKDIFKSYDSSIINTLNNYQFNFNFIGNYSDVEAKGNLLGYESQMTGISGAMKFNDSLYGVIGYGYNDIDFDGKSEGNIKSVHTGIYKDMKLNSFEVRLGVFGEYNFHEVERNITNEIAKGDFNSYLLGATGEISQRFGDSLYVKPTLSLDVTYGKYEDFTEEGAKGYNLTVDSQDYTSIVPAVEVKVGKDFEMASIYSAVKFGYEFGDMNKVQEFTFDGFGKYHLDTDNIENAQTDVKVGTAFEYNNFTFNAEVGKDFGKRDREYITAGFTYTF